MQTLKQKNYKLGIIANQIAGINQRLKNWGLLKYFDVVVTSAERGILKPNKLIFKKAFELAKCNPENAVMVGDRLDNDVLPAKQLGMKTVWLRRGLSVYQPIEIGKDIADWIINTLSDLKEIF